MRLTRKSDCSDASEILCVFTNTKHASNILSFNLKTIMGAGISNEWRRQAAGDQVMAHGEVCWKLNKNGYDCPGNFSQAISKARDNGIINNSSASNYKAINRWGNHAKHDW